MPEGGSAQQLTAAQLGQVDYRSDLRELYSDNFEKRPLGVLGELSGSGEPLMGRSRTLSSCSNAFATISIALNDPIEESLLQSGSIQGSTASTEDGPLGSERRSKFGKRLDRILKTLKGGQTI